MQHTGTGDTYIIKLEQGERVMEALTQFCVENVIDNATITGIGAVRDVRCGYYELSEKKYYFTNYPGLVEVVSMTGNVTLKDEAPFLHVHAVFTGKDNQAFGGHVEEMIVGVTLEVVLRTLNLEIERKLDDEIGLFLLNCGQ